MIEGKKRRGRPPVANAMKLAVTIHMTQAQYDAIPKNEKGNPKQDWLRDAIEEKIAKEC